MSNVYGLTVAFLLKKKKKKQRKTTDIQAHRFRQSQNVFSFHTLNMPKSWDIQLPQNLNAFDIQNHIIHWHVRLWCLMVARKKETEWLYCLYNRKLNIA